MRRGRKDAGAGEGAAPEPGRVDGLVAYIWGGRATGKEPPARGKELWAKASTGKEPLGYIDGDGSGLGNGEGRRAGGPWCRRTGDKDRSSWR